MPARAPQPVARPDLADADRGVRPVVRGDCLGGERPCPLVTCKHNLAVYDVLELPANATDDDVAATLLAMRHTCALDVVDALPGGATPEEAASKSPAPTRATKPSAAKVPPPAKPAAASPATPATGEPVEVVHVAAAPAPLDLPPRTLDEERVRFEATMRGLNDAGRALAVAKKVGGVENLEALVTRALLLAL